MKAKQINELSTLEQIKLTNLVFQIAMVGLAVPTLAAWFDDDLAKSKLFNCREKLDITNYFNSCLTFGLGSITTEELEAWLDYIVDNNNIAIKLNSKFDINDTLLLLDAIGEVCVNLWLTPMNIYDKKDNVIAKFAEQELTLANYFYLKMHG